ncbi:MAG: ECF-type sigma factor [Thermoanaerobaculales bacterium]|nr:ECF-type sigma factor [Thermoanaerobaculales bacterium]
MTELLLAYRDGDREAFDRLVPLLYDDLRRIAHWQLRRGRSSPTMGTTVLVHEIYLKMADQRSLDARDRGHFLAISAHAMRQVMADHARRRTAAKRGGAAQPVPLDEAPEIADGQARHLLDVDRALSELARHSDRMARIVECRFFAGYTEEETAEALDLSLRTVQRDWMKARAWLREALDGSDGRADL